MAGGGELAPPDPSREIDFASDDDPYNPWSSAYEVGRASSGELPFELACSASEFALKWSARFGTSKQEYDWDRPEDHDMRSDDNVAACEMFKPVEDAICSAVRSFVESESASGGSMYGVLSSDDGNPGWSSVFVTASVESPLVRVRERIQMLVPPPGMALCNTVAQAFALSVLV